MTCSSDVPSPADEPADWPEWRQRLYDAAGGLWKVRTVDLLLAPGQFALAEARTIAQNLGRYQTTIEWPDGALRTVYTEDEEAAEAYHRRAVRRILAGEL
jgi:hypothetical protein